MSHPACIFVSSPHKKAFHKLIYEKTLCYPFEIGITDVLIWRIFAFYNHCVDLFVKFALC